MDSPFYNEETIIRLLMARYTFTKRTAGAQWRDLFRITIDIDNILRAVKTQKILHTPETKPYLRPIRSSLLEARDIAASAMSDVDAGRASLYAYMAGREDDRWGVEVFIAKARDIAHKLRGCSIELQHATPQHAVELCRSMLWHLHWFPLMEDTG